MATLKLHKHALQLLSSGSIAIQQPSLQAAMKEFDASLKQPSLEYFDDELRQTIEKQLNKGELANKFSSAVTFANNEQILQIERDDQEVAAVCKMIIQNIIILWNYVELTKLLYDQMRRVEARF